MTRRGDPDFSRIRAFDGSRHHGFEELCCQLASLEPCDGQSRFFRKGPGADGGVECFLVHRDGSETGWQAKYFMALGTSQIAQLDESIAQALSKHPKLDRYCVCLPINLRDARTGKARTELQRWQAWVEEWRETPEGKKRGLEIVLWGRTELVERLGRNDPAYSGRLDFWFDEAILTPAWFRDRYERTRANLGARYVPEMDVELPIKAVVQAFCRATPIDGEFARWSSELAGLGSGVASGVASVKDPVLSGHLAELDRGLDRTCALLSTDMRDPVEDLPLDALADATRRALAKVSDCWRASWVIKPTAGRDEETYRSLDHRLGRVEDALSRLLEAVRSDRLRVMNRRRLVVSGQAGTGKSHLFGDVAGEQISNSRPAILVLGGSFIDDEPWPQIVKQLGLSMPVDSFLGALDAAAEASACRAVIFIDALNERHGIAVWADRLPGFLATLERFPRVAVAMSCRTTYEPYVFPGGIGTDVIKVQHVGFAGGSSDAARLYLEKRGIVRMTAPIPAPEFDNPLFLKTCCDFLEKDGRREFPRGLRGVTDIFRFYGDAVARQIETRLRLDPRLRLVHRALEALASSLDPVEGGYIGYQEAHDLLDGIAPSHGRFDRSLLALLVDEGVLADDPVYGPDGGTTAAIRFTFERYADHRIAARLLDEHLGRIRPAVVFAPGTPLGEFVTGIDAHRHAGVVEAIAIQLPERCRIELADAVGARSDGDHLLISALVASVPWRNPACFSKRTIELLAVASDHTGRAEDLHALIAVATEPENPFNADHMHRRLLKMPMPDRDSIWSVFVADAYGEDEGAIEALIAWTMRNGFEQIEEERARLAALTLAWLLTTSHRSARDRATKALATLLAPRLALAAELIAKFRSVDDPYVLDRVLAAAYGAAMQGRDRERLSAVAEAAFRCVFARKSVPAHALIRDHARGIVELAVARGVLPSTVEIGRARPPYRGEGRAIEDVPDETIQTYLQDYPGGHRLRDAIVGSAVNDGDFARYVVDGVVDDFSALPRRFAGMSASDAFSEWADGSFTLDGEAPTLLLELMEACLVLRQELPRSFSVRISFDEDRGTVGTDQPSEAEVSVRRLEELLCAALGPVGAAEYRLRARAYLLGGLSGFGLSHHAWPPRFDRLLARRWICKRAHDLGWTAERFAEFDRRVGSGGRYEHRVERVGKKYQWLAFHELVARLSDAQAFIGGHGRDVAGSFDGAWQVRCRDIDPSLLIARTPADGWASSERTWWTPVDVGLGSMPPCRRLDWLRRSDDLPTGEHLIDVVAPRDGCRWLVLDEFAAWHQSGEIDGDKRLERDLWIKISCLVVEKRYRADSDLIRPPVPI